MDSPISGPGADDDGDDDDETTKLPAQDKEFPGKEWPVRRRGDPGKVIKLTAQ